MMSKKGWNFNHFMSPGARVLICWAGGKPTYHIYGSWQNLAEGNCVREGEEGRGGEEGGYLKEIEE